MLYPGLLGIEVRDLSVVDLDGKLSRTVGARIIEPEFKIFVVAVLVAGDHQQKVDRSPHVEDFAVPDGNGVVVVPKGSPPAPILSNELVTDGALRRFMEKANIAQKA